MYQALYRKYRSQTFEEMVGQSVISKTLRQAVATGKISHAYLFSGPRGTGKTSAAKIFAKAMNCPNQVDGEPCNQCDLCIEITRGSLEDVIEIDAASNNGVDEIRDIRDKSTYAPSRATYKVYIIDEVHMLSTGAFNALLKTLEEPTENVVFILATTELHKIPATILSRVQRFEFKAIKLADIVNHLKWVLDKEGLTYDEEAVIMIARRAEGGMRDALSILDQALSLTSDNHLSLEIAQEMTGSIALASLTTYVEQVVAGDVPQALASLEVIFDSGKSMTRFATDLLYYLRDLLLVNVGGSSQLTIEASHLDLSQEQILSLIEQVTRSLPEIKTGLQPKLYAEMMTVRLASPATETSLPDDLAETIQGLRIQINQLEQELHQLKALTLENQPATSPKVSPKPSAFKVDKAKIMAIMEETVQNSQQSRSYLDSLKGAWNEILDSISVQDRALLLGSEPVLANGEHAILAFDGAFSAEQAMKRSNLNAVFGNIMSKVAGFSPNILAVPKRDFNAIRAEFAQKRKGQAQPAEAPKPNDLIPEGFEFLADTIETIDD